MMRKSGLITASLVVLPPIRMSSSAPTTLLVPIEANAEVMAATHAQVAQLRSAKQLSLARRTLTLLLEEKERQSVSLAQLEERSGITRGNLSKLWNDPDPNATLATIERIADAMGVKVCVTLSK